MFLTQNTIYYRNYQPKDLDLVCLKNGIQIISY